jgi:hypothetical protein
LKVERSFVGSQLKSRGGDDFTPRVGFQRAQPVFGRALLFDPTNPEPSAYNPLLEVRRGDAEVRDVSALIAADRCCS